MRGEWRDAYGGKPLTGGGGVCVGPALPLPPQDRMKDECNSKQGVCHQAGLPRPLKPGDKAGSSPVPLDGGNKAQFVVSLLAWASSSLANPPLSGSGTFCPSNCPPPRPQQHWGEGPGSSQTLPASSLRP